MRLARPSSLVPRSPARAACRAASTQTTLFPESGAAPAAGPSCALSEVPFRLKAIKLYKEVSAAGALLSLYFSPSAGLVIEVADGADGH